jgi:hypothetical protein
MKAAYHRDSAFLDDRTRDATAQSSATTRDDEGYGAGGSSVSLGGPVDSALRGATYSGLRSSSLFIVGGECGVVCDSGGIQCKVCCFEELACFEVRWSHPH